MAIVRWSPAQDLAGLHSAMDRLFGDVFGDPFAPGGATESMERAEGGNGKRRQQLPTLHLPVNIYETKDGYSIEAPVRRFRPEDVECTFSDGILTIDARRGEEKTRQEGTFLRREVAFGNYPRQISLPGNVRADDIKATFDNGVLNVVVPRMARPEPKRIQIRPGEQAKQAVGAGSCSKN